MFSEEIDLAKCEKNLNHVNPPIMDLVDIIRKLNEKNNVNSLSEEKLHGTIEEAFKTHGTIEEAFKRLTKKDGWFQYTLIQGRRRNLDG